jgi:VanZ family protein
MGLSRILMRYEKALRTLFRAGFAASVLLVVVLSVLPQEVVPVFRISDKVAHFIAYAAIAALGVLGFQGAAGGVVIGVVALGGALEVVQAYIPGRSAELLDFVVDVVGVAAGYLLARLLRPLWAQRGDSAPERVSG